MESLTYICSECDSKNIITNLEELKFPYGVGAESVQLSCEIPVHRCKDCGYGFIDKEAENLRHEAVCHHLKVMTPRQIKKLRKLHDFTQTYFAEITRLGKATLSRWERGAVIQNGAYDSYLYLLGFRDNLERLLNKNNLPSTEIRSEKSRPKFKKIDATSEELLRKQKEFELCPI